MKLTLDKLVELENDLQEILDEMASLGVKVNDATCNHEPIHSYCPYSFEINEQSVECSCCDCRRSECAQNI